MSTTEAVTELRKSVAADVAKGASKAAAVRAALGQARLRAGDFTNRAHSRARNEVERRRFDAADTLESIAKALRPDGSARSRRKSLGIAGGAGLALTAVLGAGVALGFVLSRKLQKRDKTPVEAEATDEAPLAVTPDPAAGVTTALDY